MDKWMDLSEAQLLKLVPDRAGLFFVGCPNCTGGLQENQLKSWSPDEPDVVRCCYCGMAYPNDRYPDNKVEEVITPGGNKISYPYYENKDGYRYYFTAAREYDKRDFCEAFILKLAFKWQETGKLEYARKAALMLHRFATVWPDYCWHYDYPFIQKEWYQGYVAPEKCRQGYRTARYHWWGFTDLDHELLSAYEILIKGSFWEDLDKELKEDVRGKIEWFFRDNADHLIAQKTGLGNMHPYLWHSIVKLGRILKDVKYMHYPFPDMKRLLKEGFFADGTWHEGSPDYTAQTLHGIIDVCKAYGDWTDPSTYIPGESDFFLDGSPVQDFFPEIRRAETALEKLRFPYGHRLTLHDSWGHSVYPYPEVPSDHREESFLLPVLGHGCLTGGKGKSTGRVDLTWSGGYGHEHMDGLSLTVTAFGREMLSDIGYTHTKYRCLTLATAAHNTVVVDHENQHRGGMKHPTDGNCRFFYDGNPVFQTVSVDNPQVYPGKVQKYTRTLARVQTDSDNFYMVDLFSVKGGGQHDYILHGDCIAEQKVLTEVPSSEYFSPVETLIPEGVTFIPPTGEHHSGNCQLYGYTYGFMSRIKGAMVPKTDWTRCTFQYTGRPVGPEKVSENQTPDEQESKMGIRIHCHTKEKDGIFTGYIPSVRQGRDNDDLLDQYMHPFIMLRRTPDKEGSVFCTVMEPYADKAKIDAINVVYQQNDSVILQVTWTGVCDYVFYNIHEEKSFDCTGINKSDRVTVKGAYGFLRIRDEQVETGVVSCGWIGYRDFRLSSDPMTVCPVEKVVLGDEESHVTVFDPEGRMKPDSEETVLLRRDNRTFGYKAIGFTHKGEYTEITVKGWPGFTFDPQNNQSVDLCFPSRSYKGDHEVTWMPTVYKTY